MESNSQQQIQISVNALLTTAMQRCNNFLDKLLPTANIGDNQLNSAMRYAVMNGGKRLRPALVYAAGEVLDIPPATLDAAAACIELIHCYSLIHDDLPAMDDDDLRRGTPSCHKAFDEATAILAGDALQTTAFELLSNAELNPVSAEIRIEMVKILAQAAGANGMVLGQAQDMAAMNSQLFADMQTTAMPLPTKRHLLNTKEISNAKASMLSAKLSITTKAEEQNPALDALITIHKNKTGALFSAAIQLALCCSTADLQTESRLCTYADNIGLGFQVADDILDVTMSTATLGKPAGSDQKSGKLTFPVLLGLDRAKEYAEHCHQQAIAALAMFGTKANALRDISAFFITRSY